jgi:hypothetical protein
VEVGDVLSSNPPGASAGGEVSKGGGGRRVCSVKNLDAPQHSAGARKGNKDGWVDKQGGSQVH